MIQSINSWLQSEAKERSSSTTATDTLSSTSDDLSYSEVFNSLSSVTEDEEESSTPQVPDLSTEAWINDGAATRAALVEYAKAIIEGEGSVTEKYQTLRENLPAELFNENRINWLNQALPGNNAAAAKDLVGAIDPYFRDTWKDPDTGATMNSLAAGSFPDAVRVGYDSNGYYYSLTTAQDVENGEYRDISDELAMSIILGETLQQGADTTESEASTDDTDAETEEVADDSDTTETASSTTATDDSDADTEEVTEDSDTTVTASSATATDDADTETEEVAEDSDTTETDGSTASLAEDDGTGEKSLASKSTRDDTGSTLTSALQASLAAYLENVETLVGSGVERLSDLIDEYT